MRPNIAMQLTTTNQFDHHDQLTTIKPTTTITITHCDGLYDWLNSKFKVLLHVARWYGIMVWYGRYDWLIQVLLHVAMFSKLLEPPKNFKDL
jgi:hypothetical protein